MSMDGKRLLVMNKSDAFVFESPSNPVGDIAMKRLFLAIFVTAALLAWTSAARAIAVNCIICGNTNLGPATISYAVISGIDFNSELAVHSIGFSGVVPPGTLDAIPNVTAPTDFVYLYQLVNFGPPLFDYTVASAGIVAPLLTGGGRLESTLFVDPPLGTVSPGPAGAIPALSPGSPAVDFINGLGAGGFGPCQSSGPPGINCSDATANLLPGLVQGTNFAETPFAPLLDPMWTSSLMWFSIAAGPGTGLATATDPTGVSFSGFVPAPAAIPLPAAVWLFGSALVGFIGLSRRRSIT